MPQDWADKIAQQILSKGLIHKGICLILGAADTGKTTLTAALAKYTASHQAVGIIDADIGQSHIGPPATVGWAVVEEPGQLDFSQLAVGGISFVGDVTPTGHLLQLTAAITQSVQQVSKVAELILIDTPGFVFGPAATALWWNLQRILKPKLILAVQHNDELADIIAGLQLFDIKIELIKSSPDIPTKSPQSRRTYRKNQFCKYFQNSRLYNITLSSVAIQAGRNLKHDSFVGRLVALRDVAGTDVTIGLITDWRNDRDIAAIRAPQLDIKQIRCLVIGDVTIDIPGE